MIRIAEPGDVVGCGVTMERAFATDPVMRYLFPTDEQYATLGAVVCRNVMRSSLAADGLWCFDDHRAFAAWLPPGRSNVDHTEEQWDRSLVDIERFVALNTITAEHRPSEPHWYLEVLGTDPEWQSTGCGSALLGVVFEQLVSNPMACYLETETERLVRFYQRHGFVVRSEWDLPFEGPHMWGMLRRPEVTDRTGETR